MAKVIVQEGVREEGRCAARTRTEEGQKRAKGARSFLAYRSRGPGRTILLDLCARAIARSSRGPLQTATSASAIALLFAKIIRHAARSSLLFLLLSSPLFLPPRSFESDVLELRQRCVNQNRAIESSRRSTIRIHIFIFTLLVLLARSHPMDN
jgi:hypothetical protein